MGIPTPTTETSSLYEELLARDRRKKFRRRRLFVSLAAAVVVVGLAVTGVVAYGYFSIENGIRRSDILAGQVPPLNGDQNILIMGLDSRLDENGKALPAEAYDALHAGGADVGGYNANVLMLLHLPADGSKATVISIPRDDYVDLVGSPDGVSQGKIKQAYGYALDAAMTRLTTAGGMDESQIYQAARDAGRKAEIDTVSQFLGGVQINHFIEVTMAAFLGVAKAVAPITVCLNEATQDTYSGADFKAGIQQIDAAQAVAFVRQRRDTSNPDLELTDLDRARRQQAFIVSVAHQLQNKGTFTDLGKLQGILDSAKSNIAVDSGLNLLTLAQQAKSLTGGNMSFTTLPITGFGTSPEGESINTVDVDQVRSTVKRLLTPPAPAKSPAANATSPEKQTTNTVPAPSEPSDSTQAGPAASSPASTPSAHADNHYDDWTGALQGGAVPCVR